MLSAYATLLRDITAKNHQERKSVRERKKNTAVTKTRFISKDEACN